MGNPVKGLASALAALKNGFKTTYVHQPPFTKPVTVQYPEERRELPERTRWRHVLTRHEDGLERCIGCSLCAGACPSKCIYVEAADNTDEDRRSPGERYAARYEINILRCIFCGYCQEACPTGAIVLRQDFELADHHREDFLYTKEKLLEPMPKSDK